MKPNITNEQPGKIYFYQMLHLQCHSREGIQLSAFVAKLFQFA